MSGYDAEVFERAGVDWAEFYAGSRDLYDEYMAYQDFQIGNLVARLKAEGQWENTLFILAADHGSGHLRKLIQPMSGGWSAQAFSYVYRIPLLFVWPGHIQADQRIDEPVSMIDVVPTVLEALELPGPSTMQGQSLLPALTGAADWDPGPVILDEFYFDSGSGELRGTLQQVDRRWIADLDVNPTASSTRPPLTLYDRWTDPIAGASVHEQYPQVAKRYEEFLRRKWREHQELASQFSSTDGQPMTPEQLDTLRALGYIN